MGSQVRDIVWLQPDGSEMTAQAWQQGYASALGVFLSGEGLNEVDGRGRPVRDDSFLLLFNAAADGVAFAPPPDLVPARGTRLVDTADAADALAEVPFDSRAVHILAGRSLVLVRFDRADPAMKRQHDMPFGARLLPQGGAEFRLWAPTAQRVDLVLNGRSTPLAALADGWYAGTAAAAAGDRYAFCIDGDLVVPDPASRSNPDDVHGASELTDPQRLRLAGRRLARPPLARGGGL